jgi:chaperonin GroES
MTADNDQLPVRMLHDRVLVEAEKDAGERMSGGGIVIPSTVELGKRLSWAKVVAVGPHVRSVAADDRVLFDPEAMAEVEIRSKNYGLLRERDLHAVAASRITDGHAGLYL